jgi:hypothetical protein
METLLITAILLSAGLWLGQYWRKSAQSDGPCGGCSGDCRTKCHDPLEGH